MNKVSISVPYSNDHRTIAEKLREKYEFEIVSKSTQEAIWVELRSLLLADDLFGRRTAEREEAKELLRGYLNEMWALDNI
jgi:hypothetical protein